MKKAEKNGPQSKDTAFLGFFCSTDIDTVISEDIFKNDDEDSRREAMLGLIDLKSAMDDRVRELFQDNLQCKEEVEQIKNIYRYTLLLLLRLKEAKSKVKYLMSTTY